MAAPPTAPAMEGAPTGMERWLVTTAIIIGTLMGAIDMSIINVALPAIRSSLGATLTEISWVATGYLVAVVVVLPLTAWLAAVVGRRNLYLAALALFTLSSVACGLSTSLPMLIFFRIVQGIGAGFMQPIAMAILRESFPPAEQAMAMGLFGIAILLGPAIGPTLGGWLTDNYSWPWIFFINLPIGLVAMFMASEFVTDPPYLRRQRASDVDYLGVLLLTVGLSSLQIVLSEGQSNDWFESPVITGLALLSALTVAGFVAWELRTKKPAVDLSIMANASYTSGTLLGGMLGLALFGSMFLMPLFMQELLGYDATQSGIAMLPRSLVMMIAMPVAGRIYNRVGPRLMIGTGLLLSAFAAFEMGRFTADTSYAGLIMPQLWQGVAFSLIFVSLSTAALARVERHRMTNATALYNLIRQLGGSFGIAIFATLLEKRQAVGATTLMAHLNPYNAQFVTRYQAAVHGLIARGVPAALAPRKALALLNGLAQRQAAVMSFEYAFMLIGVLFVIITPLVLLLRSHNDHMKAEARARAAEAEV